MGPETWSRFQELLDEVLELDPPLRQDLLDGLTGEDRALVPTLREWLALEGEARGFLEAPAAPGASWDRSDWMPHGPGACVGGYRVLRVIGFGGTSVVYEAEQEAPRRSVALKVFQAGLASSRIRERFANESRILASLRHQGIAQVYEAGTVGRGEGVRPWIAMELVPEARRITDYASSRRLDTHARVRLFVEACDAVAHGHQRGVIHRDLKPANLLVDGAGRPKVIDFGVAKVLDGELALQGPTLCGNIVGTLAWMSPEQLAGDPGLVDTRGDVYALGVVLYELLCGVLPFPLAELSIDEALRAIRTASPRPPSAVCRSADGDLDAVLRSCLAKHPDDRYRTAGELAADLRRWLRREPVVARRPSLLHHLRLLFARHRRVAVAAAAGAVLLLTAVSAGALHARRVEARERERARHVTRFLESVLSLGLPSIANRGDIGIEDVLDDASLRIDVELASSPDARAEVHSVVGAAWLELGAYERAETHLRASAQIYRERMPGSSELGCALSMLSDVLLVRGKGREGEVVLLEAKDVFAADEEAPPFLQGITDCKLARAYQLQGRMEEAEEVALRALHVYSESFGVEHTSVASAQLTLAGILAERGRLEEAEQRAQEALTIHQGFEGEGSLACARARLELAEIADRAGREELRRERAHHAAQDLERLLPDAHPLRARAEALAAPRPSGTPARL